MKTTHADRKLAHEFYYKETTGVQREWIVMGGLASVDTRESINEDVVTLADLLASVRADGAAHGAAEVVIRHGTGSKALGVIEDLQGQVEGLLSTCAQAVSILREMQRPDLAVIIERRVSISVLAAGVTVRDGIARDGVVRRDGSGGAR